ncbi:hypothetical protein O181_131968 [Austropuccinia psidii MF-1]|uniref:Uncharacterized protein n=1 Tax=Austropuccinia psidii MF-1 TaxID=1389203 RepID=A0A9Q3L2Z4_9BASI|nr:hypothetical protein [Austropuccinia psidii MF-1]
MIPSVWAPFPEKYCFTCLPWKRQPLQPQEKQNTKMGLPSPNKIQLGSFGREEVFTLQEKMAEKIARTTTNIPRSYKEAMNSEDKENWAQEIEEELNNMRRMEVFEVAPISEAQRTITESWIFSKKIDNLTGGIW